jgi:hypothetical protein
VFQQLMIADSLSDLFPALKSNDGPEATAGIADSQFQAAAGTAPDDLEFPHVVGMARHNERSNYRIVINESPRDL